MISLESSKVALIKCELSTMYICTNVLLIFVYTSYSYTTSCCGLSGIQEAVTELEAEEKPRLLIE